MSDERKCIYCGIRETPLSRLLKDSSCVEAAGCELRVQEREIDQLRADLARVTKTLEDIRAVVGPEHNDLAQRVREVIQRTEERAEAAESDLARVTSYWRSQQAKVQATHAAFHDVTKDRADWREATHFRAGENDTAAMLREIARQRDAAESERDRLRAENECLKREWYPVKHDRDFCKDCGRALLQLAKDGSIYDAECHCREDRADADTLRAELERARETASHFQGEANAATEQADRLRAECARKDEALGKWHLAHGCGRWDKDCVCGLAAALSAPAADSQPTINPAPVDSSVQVPRETLEQIREGYRLLRAPTHDPRAHRFGELEGCLSCIRDKGMDALAALLAKP